MGNDNVPAELERRIRALESPQGQGDDFDGASWFWLLLLGLAVPVVILIAGWVA